MHDVTGQLLCKRLLAFCLCNREYARGLLQLLSYSDCIRLICAGEVETDWRKRIRMVSDLLIPRVGGSAFVGSRCDDALPQPGKRHIHWSMSAEHVQRFPGRWGRPYTL